MAPKSGKRTVAPAAAGRPRKAAKTSEHPTQHGERLKGVMRAVEGVAGLPDSCRTMLLAMLPPSLGAPADARHPLQAHAVGLVAEALAQARSEKEAAVSAAAARAAQAEAHRSELEAAKASAESALELKAGRARETEAALDSASSGRAEARAALDTARKAEQGSKLAESAKRAECDAFVAALAEHFAALREGAWDDADAAALPREGAWDDGAAAGERHLAALEPALQKAELDSSIVASLRVVGAKRAADRTSFEVMVLEQVGASLSEKASGLRAELAERGPALERRAAEVAARQADVESAGAKVQERASAFERAQAEMQGGEEARAAAELALQGFAGELAAATEAQDAAQAELDLFLQGPLADFELLRDTTAKAAEAAAEVAEGSAATIGGA